MKVSYKVWLDENGKVFGEGPYILLKLIEKEGSIHRAALSMGISYRKAWTILKNVEKRLGFTLLQKRIGGQKGGGSSLTPIAKEFLKVYENFRRDVDKSLQRIFKRYFSKMFGIN